MVIEWLKFRVTPAQREKFIREDDKIWTPVLANCPGFLGKEVWIDPNRLEEVVVIVRWDLKEQWKAVPQKLLDETEQKMQQAMSEGYELVEAGEYQVRKFPHT